MGKVVGGIVCAECGLAALRTGPMQKYCRSCSERRDLVRKRLWAREHPQQRDHAANYAERRAEKLARGKVASAEHAHNIAWLEDPPALRWLVRISVPFTYRISKNSLFGMNRRGHVFLREEAKAARNAIILRLTEAMRGQPVAHNRLWIDILVQKPNHKGDAINVIDSVCDGIKMAVPLDDRWYSLRRVDWQIVKDDPRLFIGVGQDDVRDIQPCSICGALKPFDEFNKCRGGRNGIGRECRECRRSVRAARRIEPERAANDNREGDEC